MKRQVGSGYGPDGPSGSPRDVTRHCLGTRGGLILSQGTSLEPEEIMLLKADLRDEIEAIGRKQTRLLFSYISILVALALAIIHGTLAVPAAAISVMLLVPLKKAIVRYRTLASRKAELVGSLQSAERPVEAVRQIP